MFCPILMDALNLLGTMSFLRKVRSAILGDSDLPEQCAVGLRGPQSLVRVLLLVLGTPLDSSPAAT
jgi:hypothetical protein